MPGRDDGLWVVWPHQFDARRSRAEGRRVPVSLAVQKPDAKWVESAAKKAGFEPTLEEDARHSGRPFEACGRVLIPASGSKEDALRKIAQQMQG